MRYKSLLLAFLLAAASLHAQQHFSAPRPDGKSTPLMLYKSVASNICAPLAIISHGAGGSENGYRYLAQSMADLGFTTIVMGHAKSGLSALRDDMRTRGIRPGIQALVADPEAEQDRLIDITATLNWADKQCHAFFRVLLGHSMGAETVMLDAGARNMINVTTPPAGQSRFDAYVALSPEGPGIVFPEHAWSGIRKPLLVLTGTRDGSLKGGPQARQIPWHDLPGTPAKCQWMGVIDNASHMNFAGSGPGANNVEPIVTQTIATFLKGVQAHSCALPSPIPEMTLQAK